MRSISVPCAIMPVPLRHAPSLGMREEECLLTSSGGVLSVLGGIQRDFGPTEGGCEA